MTLSKTLLLFSFLIINFFAVGQTAQYVFDSSEVEWFNYQEDIIEQYKNDSDFNYLVNIKEQKPSILKRWFDALKRYLWEKLNLKVSDKAVNSVFIIAILLGLILLIVFLVRRSSTGMFSREDKDLQEFQLKDIKEANTTALKRLIEEKEQSKSWIDALRYRYMLTLKSMDEKSLILWKEYKTNSDYFKEIKDAEILTLFQSLTRVFEYHYYGGNEVEANTYQLAKEDSDLLLNNIEKAQLV